MTEQRSVRGLDLAESTGFTQIAKFNSDEPVHFWNMGPKFSKWHRKDVIRFFPPRKIIQLKLTLILLLCICLLNSSTMSRMWHKVNFWAEYSWFEFRIFFLDSLPHQGERTDWFMPFSSALARSETQTALYGIWTRVVDSIFYDDYRYGKVRLFLNVYLID